MKELRIYVETDEVTENDIACLDNFISAYFKTDDIVITVDNIEV